MRLDFQMSATATEDNQPVVGEVDAKENAKSKAAAEPEAKPPGIKKRDNIFINGKFTKI